MTLGESYIRMVTISLHSLYQTGKSNWQGQLTSQNGASCLALLSPHVYFSGYLSELWSQAGTHMYRCSVRLSPTNAHIRHVKYCQ